MTEKDILGQIERAAAGPSGRASRGLTLGIGDDAALFRPHPGREIILTTDWFLQGTHFLLDKHPADSIGWKCLARAVSDVAAMGGVPRCCLLSLTIPEDRTGAWLRAFLRGLRRASQRFECPLAGGDTTKRHEVLISITVVGEVRRGQAIRRRGAKAGDLLYVSGRLGEAERGLELLRKSKSKGKRTDPHLKKHLYPEPRLALGQWLAEKRMASAMMDLSDGLSSDLPKLCAASGVGACVEAGLVPTSRIVRGTASQRKKSLHLALHGGDDYELLFTVPRAKASKMLHSFQGVRLTRVGSITSGSDILLKDEDGHLEKFEARGWDPFRK